MNDGTISRARKFAQLPDALIDDSRVSPLAVRLYAKLDRYAGRDGRAFPSRARLAADLNVSMPTITRALSQLSDTGWITRTARSGAIWDTRLNDAPLITDEQALITSDPTPDHQRSGTLITDEQQKESQGRIGKKNSSSSSPRRAPRSDATNAKTGTRLPDDFTPSPELIEWARVNAPNAGMRDHERFMDYWRGIAGGRGRKLDWPATWRNWMRKESDERAERTGPKASTTDARVKQAQSLRERAVALDQMDGTQALDGTPRFAIGAS